MPELFSYPRRPAGIAITGSQAGVRAAAQRRHIQSVPIQPGRRRKLAAASGSIEEAAMNGTMTGALTHTIVLSALTVGLFAASPAMASFIGDGRHKGGYVKPCSLDGVNPAYHLDIFANPALARADYGFVRGRDGTWQVENNCHIYN
jgi:hypothetical protein